MPGRSHVDITRAALEGGVRIIQFRDKNSTDERMIEVGREIRKLTKQFGAIFIVNDRLEVALQCDADGLHVGQGDQPAGELRRILGDRILGVSVATVDEAIIARNDGADYLGVGPVFATSTKADAGAVTGLDMLRLTREASGLPVVAIGGINERNVADIAKSGADSASVISAIVCADDMVQAARNLIEIWKSSR
jgi:thiamine-phosphate diphosphorylase